MNCLCSRAVPNKFNQPHQQPTTRPTMEEQLNSGTTRMRTRAKNATAHPGIAAKDALRARRAPRDPEVIQKERDDKEARREAKAAAEALKVAGERYVEQLDRAATATNKDQMPRRRPVQKGQKKRQHAPSITVSHNPNLLPPNHDAVARTMERVGACIQLRSMHPKKQRSMLEPNMASQS